MDMKDLRKKSAPELEKTLKEKVLSLNNFRLGIAKSAAKNVKQGRNLKKEIARILTLQKESAKAK